MKSLFYLCSSFWIIALLVSIANANNFLIEAGFALGLIFMILKIIE